MFAENIQTEIPANLSFSHELVKPNSVLNDLNTQKAKLIFTNKEFETDDVESMYLGVEYLSVQIDKFNPLSQRKQVSFNDLAGLSFLVVQDIGPWRDVVEENIPNATFLYQENLNAMGQITRYSNFPFFFSNLTQAEEVVVTRSPNDNRTPVKIDDPNNQMEVYGTYLKSNRDAVQPVLKEIINSWPK